MLCWTLKDARMYGKVIPRNKEGTKISIHCKECQITVKLLRDGSVTARWVCSDEFVTGTTIKEVLGVLKACAYNYVESYTQAIMSIKD